MDPASQEVGSVAFQELAQVSLWQLSLVFTLVLRIMALSVILNEGKQYD